MFFESKPVDASTPIQRYDNAKKKLAKDDGAKVGKELAGYTTEKECQDITERLNYTDTDNIHAFLEGYSTNMLPEYIENVPLMGLCAKVSRTARQTVFGVKQNFFTQLESEYGFPEKQSLLRSTAKKYFDYLLKNNNKNGKDYTKQLLELRRILDKNNIDSDTAKILDRIVNETI